MKAQTWIGSLWESWQSTVIGFVLAWLATTYVGPFFGIAPGAKGVLGFTLFMTVLSVVRGYAVRRWNEHKSGKHVPPDFRHIIEDIAEERNRQIHREGFTLSHDDEHTDRSLAAAAATYAFSAACTAQERIAIKKGEDATLAIVKAFWPDAWAFTWFKPTHPRRDLVKAAALIVAEIGRLDRTKRRT